MRKWGSADTGDVAVTDYLGADFEVWCAKPDDSRHGPYTKWSNGRKWSEGYYVEGAKHGRWTELFTINDDFAILGVWEEGGYEDGKRLGQWLSWYPSGQKAAEITYKNGEFDGTHTYWYQSGQKK